MNYYPDTYHAACNELVAFGASRPERAAHARKLIADALRAMRARHGSRTASITRRGMLFIAGHFPAKF